MTGRRIVVRGVEEDKSPACVATTRLLAGFPIYDLVPEDGTTCDEDLSEAVDLVTISCPASLNPTFGDGETYVVLLDYLLKDPSWMDGVPGLRFGSFVRYGNEMYPLFPDHWNAPLPFPQKAMFLIKPVGNGTPLDFCQRGFLGTT